MKKKLLALVLALSLLMSCAPVAVADFLPTLPPDASTTVAPQVTAAPEEAAEPEEPAPSASVTVATETVEVDLSSLRSGLKVWIGMNGSLYVKNTTGNYMKFVRMFFRVDGGEPQAMDDVFSLSAGQTKKIRTPEEVQQFMTENDVESIEFLALQSATSGGSDYVAASDIAVFAPKTVYAVIDNMPVYRSDNTSSGRLYSVDAGSSLLMLNDRDDWARVYTDKGIGYTRIKYLALAEGLPSIVTEDTFVYEEATMNSGRTEIAEGTTVYLVGKNGKFFLIRDAAGEYAYILKTDLAEYDGEVVPVAETAPEEPASAEPAPETAPEEATEEPAAPVPTATVDDASFSYQDAGLSLSFRISEGEWVYQKDEASGQLYLQETGGTADDLLSISAQQLPQGAQFASLHQQAWANISASLTTAGIAISALTEEDRAIGADGQYSSHIYRMTLTTSGVDFQCAYAFWCTETHLYVCSLSATTENADKMLAAMDELLASYAPVN